jgi:Flp pilus assembly protein TadD
VGADHLSFGGYAHAGDTTSASDLGYGAIQQGDWAEAESQLRAELKSNPKDPMRMLNLAYVLQNQGRADEAAGLYQ